LSDHNLLRNQQNPSSEVCRAYNITSELARPYFSHNLQNIFDDYRFYPLLGGKRRKTKPSTWQPCLSAAGLVAQAVSAAGDYFDANPGQQMFSLGINDGQDWCECDDCRSLCPADQQKYQASQRWWSEPYWSFVNQVALQISEKFPGKRVGALAYSSVLRPPSFTLQSNVTVYVCLDAASHFDPIARSRDTQYLLDWNRVCSDVGLYNYAGLVSWIFPRYCRDEMANDMKEAAGMGIKHFYIEDTWVGELAGPLPWITRKLVEDPSLDVDRLQYDYCRYLFGDASESMELYFNYLEKVWQSAPRGKWFDGLFQIDEQVLRYPPQVRQNMYKYLNIARNMAGGNHAILRRINDVAAPLQLAEAFAQEHDIMLELENPISNPQDLAQAEKNLARLYAAREHRQKLIASLDSFAWGLNARQALSASQIEPTLSRWERLQNARINAVKKRIDIIRNVLNNI